MSDAEDGAPSGGGDERDLEELEEEEEELGVGNAPPANAPAPTGKRARRRRSPEVTEALKTPKARIPKPATTALTRKGKVSQLNVMGPAPGETMYGLGDAVELGGNLTKRFNDKRHRRQLSCTGNSYANYAQLGLVERARKRLDKAVQMAAAARGFRRRSLADYPSAAMQQLNEVSDRVPIFLKFNYKKFVAGQVEDTNNSLVTVFDEKFKGDDYGAPSDLPNQVRVTRLQKPSHHLHETVAQLDRMEFSATSDEEAKRVGRLLSQSLSNAKRMWSLQCQSDFAPPVEGLLWQVPKVGARCAPWELYEGYRLVRVAETYPLPPLVFCARKLFPMNPDDPRDKNYWVWDYDEGNENDRGKVYPDAKGTYVEVTDLRVVPDGEDPDKYQFEFKLEGQLRSTAHETKPLEAERHVREPADNPWRVRLYVRPNPARVAEECSYATSMGTSRRLPNRLSISQFATHFWQRCGEYNPQNYARAEEPLWRRGPGDVKTYDDAEEVLRARKLYLLEKSFREVNQQKAIQTYRAAERIAKNRGEIQVDPNDPGLRTSSSQAVDSLHRLLGSRAIGSEEIVGVEGSEFASAFRGLANHLKEYVVPKARDCAKGVDEEFSDDRIARRLGGHADGLTALDRVVKYSELAFGARSALLGNRQNDPWFNEQVRAIELRMLGGRAVLPGEPRSLVRTLNEGNNDLKWENNPVAVLLDSDAIAPDMQGELQLDLAFDDYLRNTPEERLAFDFEFDDFFPAAPLIVSAASCWPEVKDADGKLLENPFLGDPRVALIDVAALPEATLDNRIPYLPYRMPVYAFVDFETPEGRRDAEERSRPPPDHPENETYERFLSFWPIPRAKPTLRTVFEGPDNPLQDAVEQLRDETLVKDALPLLEFLRTSKEVSEIQSYGHILRILPQKKAVGKECNAKAWKNEDAENLTKAVDADDKDARERFILESSKVVLPTRPAPSQSLPATWRYEPALVGRPKIVTPARTPASAYWNAFRALSVKSFLSAPKSQRIKGPGLRDLVSKQFRFGIYGRMLQHWLWVQGFRTKWHAEVLGLNQAVSGPLPPTDGFWRRADRFNSVLSAYGTLPENRRDERVAQTLQALSKRVQQAFERLKDFEKNNVPGASAPPDELSIRYLRRVQVSFNVLSEYAPNAPAALEEVSREVEAVVEEIQNSTDYADAAVVVANSIVESYNARLESYRRGTERPWFQRYPEDRGGYVSARDPGKSSRAMYPLHFEETKDFKKKHPESSVQELPESSLYFPDRNGRYSFFAVDPSLRGGETRQIRYEAQAVDLSVFPRVKLDGLFGSTRFVLRRGETEPTRIACRPSPNDENESAWLDWLDSAGPKDLVFDSYDLVWSNFKYPYGYDTLGLDFLSAGVQSYNPAVGVVFPVPVYQQNPVPFVMPNDPDFVRHDAPVEADEDVDSEAYSREEEELLRKRTRKSAAPRVPIADGGAIPPPARGSVAPPSQELVFEETAEVPSVGSEREKSRSGSKRASTAAAAADVGEITEEPSENILDLGQYFAPTSETEEDQGGFKTLDLFGDQL